MTPPKINRVDITPLDSLHLENLLGMEIHRAAEQFRGTDLSLDVESGELQRLLAGGQVETTSLEQESAWIQLIRESDANGDKALDLEETRKILASNLPEEQANAIDPDQFLTSIDHLMKTRYVPLAENMKAFRSDTLFSPTLDAVKLYNDGILMDELGMAHRTFRANGLGKTAVNIVGFLPSLARNLWTDSPALLGDALAEDAAYIRHRERLTAIESLEAVVSKGIQDKAEWAASGDLKAALALVEDTDHRAILEEELCALKLHDVLYLQDAKERYNALYDFAIGERPGLLGYGGGNSRMHGGWMESAWNFSGRRNNVFFAKTVLRFLAVKSATDDPAFDDELKAKARAAFSDITGDPLAGFNNLFSVGFTNILSGLQLIDEPTEYRDWSDEAAMDGVGRAIDGALIVFASRRAFDFLGNANRLAKATTWGETVNLWRSNATLRQPFGGNSLLAAAKAAEQEAKTLGLAGRAGSKTTVGRWIDRGLSPLTRAKNAASAWLFKGLPSLSATQMAQLHSAKSAASGGLGRLTRGVLILGIVQYADETIAPPFNPFDYGGKTYDPEADFEKYPDPTLPDPTLPR